MPRNKKNNGKNHTSKNLTVSENNDKGNGIWNIFRFGESYTSLILGIVVVVVATVVLLTAVRGRNNDVRLPEVSQKNIAVDIQDGVQALPAISTIAAVRQDSKNAVKEPTKATTATPTKEPVKKITSVPTKAVVKKITVTKTKPTNTPAPRKAVVTASPIVKVSPTVNVQKIQQDQKKVNNAQVAGKTYKVAQGDTLWSIAEKKYNSGYNWVDIKEANKISNPNMISAGQTLVLPDVKAKAPIMAGSTKGGQGAVVAQQNGKIVGNSYTVVKGDNLWNISVRAYGDGFAWVKIARVNKLSNPNLIHPGNKFIIPRE